MFGAFNQETKRVLRETRRLMPGVANGIGMMLVVLKVSKRVGKKLPHRHFVDSLHVPFGTRLAACDADFFESSAFQMPGWEGVVAELQSQWSCLDASGRAAVWKNMHSLLDLSAKCTALLS